MKHIPMCWKCSDSIIEIDEEEGIRIFVGCKADPNIKSYGGACVLCPLIQPKEVKHDSNFRKG